MLPDSAACTLSSSCHFACEIQSHATMPFFDVFGPFFVEVELLRLFLLRAGVQRLHHLVELARTPAGEREVQVLHGLEIGNQAGQLLLVPLTADLVEPDVEDPRLLPREVQLGDRDCLIAEAPRGIEALVPADDSAVLSADQDRLNEAELFQAARQRLGLLGRDAPRVRRVRPQVVYGDVDSIHGFFPRHSRLL